VLPPRVVSRPLPVLPASLEPRRRAPPRLPLVSSHSTSSLAALLESEGGSATQARSAAERVVRRVFGRASGDPLAPQPWGRALFRELGIGAWAHARLESLSVELSLTIDERAPAADGTERLVLRTHDGALVETVLIPGPGRTTVCISSQVGCARACSFCETGAHGLDRQLDAGEIVDQVRIAKHVWGARSPALQNVVFMGMGEPFDNLAEVARATHVLTDDVGLRLTPSRVTVSTVGVADKIATFFATCRAELAVSLNAPDDARRDSIMPVNHRFPLATLMRAIQEALPRGRKVLFEYVLIAGVNDAPGDAELVAELVREVPCRVNVIPLNRGPDDTLRTPSSDAVDRFVERLASLEVTTLVRRPRGRDVGGACGQLAGARRERITSSG
jgi:23S rRNA (adenine2503-C2)-methyltransferase